MNLTDRLRSVVGPARPGGLDAPAPAPVDPDLAADLLGGEWGEWHGHRYLVIDRRYPPGHRHGRVSVADSAPDASGLWPALGLLDPALAGCAPPPGGRASGSGRVLFLDLETTGLSGGAGTHAFLVGCGWFDEAAFRVRQLLLTGVAAERALLEATGEIADGAAAIATYNGKTFDLPVLDTRYLFHRMAAPFGGVPHLDLLHPARQLWRGPCPADLSHPWTADPAGTCRLSAVEASVLGHVRDGDVPGLEIPARYFQYVRSGDPRPLAAVLEHNRLDLLSLAMLTARLALLVDRGADAATTAREALGLGRLYQRGGRLAAARACFARAADMESDQPARTEALRAYAIVCRRAREHDTAAGAWRRLLELPACPPHVAREAREALAVHCEHRLRDFQAARRLAVEALRLGASAARADAIHHRVARLDRKLASPLF